MYRGDEAQICAKTAKTAKTPRAPREERQLPRWFFRSAICTLQSCFSLLGGLGVLAVLAQCSVPTVADAGAQNTSIQTLSTSHYRIQTDLDPEFAKDVAIRMDAMFDEYARRFAVIAPLRDNKPLAVYLFARRADYLRFVGPAYYNTGGLFMPSRGIVAAFLEGQGRDGLRRTIQHEAFHQFTHAALGYELPPWLNEGLAQLFEEALWTGDGFLLQQIPPRRVRQMQADLAAGRLVAFDRFALLTPERWASAFTGDPARGAGQYNQAWAMVQFLARERDESREPYLPRLVELLTRLGRGENAAAAFHAVLPDTPALQRHFLHFAMNLRATSEAELLERQTVLADLIVDLASHGPLPARMSDVRRELDEGRYQIHYWQGDWSWDSNPDAGFYFCGLNGKAFGEDDLFFEPNGSGVLKSVVCRWSDHITFRTRFFGDTAAVEHETVIETGMVSTAPSPLTSTSSVESYSGERAGVRGGR